MEFVLIGMKNSAVLKILRIGIKQSDQMSTSTVAREIDTGEVPPVLLCRKGEDEGHCRGHVADGVGVRSAQPVAHREADHPLAGQRGAHRHRPVGPALAAPADPPPSVHVKDHRHWASHPQRQVRVELVRVGGAPRQVRRVGHHFKQWFLEQATHVMPITKKKCSKESKRQRDTLNERLISSTFFELED